MKQYSLVVILHICLLAILSVGVYVLYCADLWFSMLITFLFLLGTGIHLYYIQMKQLQMMRRLTDSLRYNDMTQAFRPPYKNKLMTEMAVELSETLQAFRARLLEEEIKHQYYESLLNKVDTAVLVTDMSGRIEWLNRAATAQLGQDPQLPAELLSLPSGETHTHGQSHFFSFKPLHNNFRNGSSYHSLCSPWHGEAPYQFEEYSFCTGTE